MVMYADMRKDRSADRCDATTAFDEAGGSQHHKVPTTFQRRLQATPLLPMPSRQGGEGTGARREATAHILRIGAGNGIRTRDFDLGKVALYH